MKKPRFSFMYILFVCISINAQAVDSQYNNKSKELIIPSVKVDGSTVYYDVKVKLKEFEVLDKSLSSSLCPAQNVNNFARIGNGMTLEQVNSIIGCEGVLLETDFDDGLLKTKYLWKFDNTSDANATSIVLAFERNILIL
jgi:hypothetical protein